MDFQAMVNDTNQKNSFMLHNGIQLTKMERDHAVVEADLTTWNRNLYGAVHGGMFLTMADCAAGGAAGATGCAMSPSATALNSFAIRNGTISLRKAG